MIWVEGRPSEGDAWRDFGGFTTWADAQAEKHILAEGSSWEFRCVQRTTNQTQAERSEAPNPPTPVPVAVPEKVEVNAENKARIEKLEAIVSRKTMFDAAGVVDARWRERIEELADEYAQKDCHTGALWRDSVVESLRSLSGEEEKCPECGGSRSGLTPFFCGVCKGSGRASTPSPALEGREEVKSGSVDQGAPWLTDDGLRSAPSAATTDPHPFPIRGPAMNANQVVIVMDRAEAEETADALGFAQGNGYDNPANGSAQMVMAAALDRDPDLETLIAAALEPIPFRCEDPGCCDKQRERARSQARSVLHALQEGTTDG